MLCVSWLITASLGGGMGGDHIYSGYLQTCVLGDASANNNDQSYRLNIYYIPQISIHIIVLGRHLHPATSVSDMKSVTAHAEQQLCSIVLHKTVVPPIQ